MVVIEPPVYAVKSEAPYVIVRGLSLHSEHKTAKEAVKALAVEFGRLKDESLKILKRTGKYWSIYALFLLA
jgi:hypothetical protein